jgi:hypothetical protein
MTMGRLKPQVSADEADGNPAHRGRREQSEFTQKDLTHPSLRQPPLGAGDAEENVSHVMARVVDPFCSHQCSSAFIHLWFQSC